MPRPSMPRLSSSCSSSPSPQPTSSTFEPGSTISATSRWSVRYLPVRSGAMPASGRACSCSAIVSHRSVRPRALPRRLQEGAGDIEEFRHVEQEGVMAAIGLDLGERHPRARGVQRMHQRARFRGREQPVAGERHHAEPRLDAAKRLRQHAAMVGGDVEIVHRARQIEIAVGIEALDERRALIAQIALDLEIGVERECRQLAILHPPAELAMQRGVRKIGDVRRPSAPPQARDADGCPARNSGRCASPDRPSPPGGQARGTRCSAPSAASQQAIGSAENTRSG